MHWFWSTLILLFVFIPLTLLWVSALVDVFVNPRVSGFAAVLWLFVIIVLPFFGSLLYFLLRPVREEALMVVAPASRGSVADEVERLARLRDDGKLTEEEFVRMKARLLG